MTDIHPTAIIETGAKLGRGVRIGPYCCVGASVELGDDIELISHAVVTGQTRIGPQTRIYPFASIGHIPQDLKYGGEVSELVIGSGNTIREHVTMNPGTAGGGMVTRVGNDCLFMVGTHVAHDCQIGNNVIMANNATLGGHVVVEDGAVIGGLAAVHQFVRIGRMAMIGGMSGVGSDVIPFGFATGERAYLSGLNIVGLKRQGFNRDQLHALRSAYRLLFSSEEGTLIQRMEEVVRVYEESPAVLQLVNFMQGDSSRSVLQPKLNDE